eukprot:Rmarinus@m.10779
MTQASNEAGLQLDLSLQGDYIDCFMMNRANKNLVQVFYVLYAKLTREVAKIGYKFKAQGLEASELRMVMIKHSYQLNDEITEALKKKDNKIPQVAMALEAYVRPLVTSALIDYGLGLDEMQLNPGQTNALYRFWALCVLLFRGMSTAKKCRERIFDHDVDYSEPPDTTGDSNSPTATGNSNPPRHYRENSNGKRLRRDNTRKAIKRIRRRLEDGRHLPSYLPDETVTLILAMTLALTPRTVVNNRYQLHSAV